MAWNRHGQAVCAAGLSHGANRFWRPDALSDIGVAGGAANGNLAQRLPDPLLKHCAAYIQRQVQAHRGRLDKPNDPGDQLLECRVGADQVGAPKLVL
ncbi:hypothetical protein D3C81_1672890 [compost metagenome]